MDKFKDAKILILAGKGESSTFLFNYLNKEFSNLNVVIEEKPDRWKFIKRRAKRLGWFTAFGQVVFQATIPKMLKLASQKRRNEILEQRVLDNTPIPLEKITNVSSVNSKDSISYIKDLNPDLIILNGTRIVSKKVLRAVSCKFINTHLGITPLYRGVHGGYWALAKNDSAHCGTTIHLVDEGIDTGGILKQITVQPSPKDNFTTYPLLQLASSLPLMIETIYEILDNNSSEIEPPSGQSALWYHPTLFQYISNLILRSVR